MSELLCSLAVDAKPVSSLFWVNPHFDSSFLYRTVHNCTTLMQSRLCHHINAWRDLQRWRRVPSCLAQRSLRARRKVSDDHATQRTPRPITHIALYIIELRPAARRTPARRRQRAAPAGAHARPPSAPTSPFLSSERLERPAQASDSPPLV